MTIADEENAANTEAAGEASEPTLTNTELDIAKKRIADLEAAAAKDADVLALGRKTARDATVGSILGNAKIIKGAEAAFHVVMDAEAARLGLDLSRPLTAEQRGKLIEAAKSKVAALLDFPKPNPPPGGAASEFPAKRGL